MSIEFKLSDVEYERAQDFITTCRDELLEKQRMEMSPYDFQRLTGNGSYPYSGAIGGGVSYTFNPTSIGVGVSVNAYGKTLDITDYSLW